MFQPLLALLCVLVLSLSALAQVSGAGCACSAVVIENIDANNHLQPWMVDETLPIELAAYSKTWSVIIASLQHDFRDTTVPLAERRKHCSPTSTMLSLPYLNLNINSRLLLRVSIAPKKEGGYLG